MRKPTSRPPTGTGLGGPADLGVQFLAAPKKNSDALGWITFYVVALLAIPTQLHFGPLGSAGAPSMALGVLSLLLWSWYQASRWRAGPPGAHPMRRALWIFGAAVVASFVVAMLRPIEADEVSPATVALLSLASWCGVLLVTHDGLATRERLDKLVTRMSFAGGAFALLGIAQFVTRQSLIDHISIPGLTSSGSDEFIRGAFSRPAGTATHPIEYGVVLTMLLPLALYVGTSKKARTALGSWIPAIAILAVMPLSLSRSALVGTAVCLLLIIPTWPPARRWLTLGCIVLFGGGMSVAVPGLSGTIRGLFVTTSDDPSVQSRSDSYGVAWQFFQHSPIFGRGMGTFLPKYWIFDNGYLLLLVTVGVFGTVAFLGLLGTGVITMIRLRSRVEDRETRELAQALLASIVVGGVGFFLFDGISFPMTAGLLFLILGLTGALLRLNLIQRVARVDLECATNAGKESP